MSRKDVTGIVLGGGRSTRFGAAKLATRIDGSTLLELAVTAVDPVACAILIAGAPEPTFDVRIAAAPRFIEDAEPFAGPLAALAAVLREVKTRFAIVVGADMPGLVPRVLGAMLDRLAGEPGLEAVVLEAPAGRTSAADSPPKRQLLPVAIRVRPAVDAAIATLEAGDRSLVRFLDRLRVLEVPAAAWLRLDPAGNSVFDVDTPADLERFRAREIR